MILDLVRALLVAVLVLAVPGLLWQRVLFAPLDRIEAAAFSVALSVALVPSTALLLELLFGPGITQLIAVASVVLVTLLGV